MIREGTPAPTFQAPDDDGNTFDLAQARGSVVVMHFFVLAWSGV